MITDAHRDAIRNCHQLTLPMAKKLWAFKVQLAKIGVLGFDYSEFHHRVRVVELSSFFEYIEEYLTKLDSFKNSDFFENSLPYMQQGFSYYDIAHPPYPHHSDKNNIFKLVNSTFYEKPYILFFSSFGEKMSSFKFCFNDPEHYHLFLKNPDRKKIILHFIYTFKEQFHHEILQSISLNQPIVRAINQKTEPVSLPEKPAILPDIKRFYFDFLPDDTYLTHKETQALLSHYLGLSAKAAAKNLDISNRTFELHLNHIREKAGHSNLIELIQKTPSAQLFFQTLK